MVASSAGWEDQPSQSEADQWRALLVSVLESQGNFVRGCVATNQYKASLFHRSDEPVLGFAALFVLEVLEHDSG